MKDETGQNQYAVEPFADDGGADESAEQTIIRLMARYNLNRATAMEMIDEVQEAFGLPQRRGAGLDELKKLNARFREAMHYLIAYQDNQKTLADVRLSTRVMAYVLGFKRAAGADTIADLARQFGVKKQTPNKCKKNFRIKLGMPADDGERNDEACENMTKARKKQLAA